MGQNFQKMTAYLSSGVLNVSPTNFLVILSHFDHRLPWDSVFLIKDQLKIN